MQRFGYLAILLSVIGCSASPKIDVTSDIARAGGLDSAVIFRGDAVEGETADSPFTALTREQAVRLAVARDPRIQIAVAHVRIAQADAQQARLLPNPILNLDVRFPEGGGSRIFEATLTGDLIAVLSMPGHIKVVDHRLRAAAADALSTALDVIAEVLDGYSLAQSIDAEIDILHRRGEIVRRLRDVASNRLNVGEGTRLDVLTLDAQQIQLEVDLADKQLERTQQRLALMRLVGRPRGETEWSLEPWQEPAMVHAPELAWIDVALNNRPEIQSRAWELRALGQEVALANFAPFQGGDIGVHGERDQTWIVGPTITTPLPIFDFGQATRAKVQAQRVAAHHELNQQTNEVIEDVRRSYAAYVAFRSALDAIQNRLLPLQEQQRAQAELAYKNGQADLTTLLMAENDLQESRSKLIERQQKLTDAAIKLERSAGGAGIAKSMKAHSTPVSATTEPTSNSGAQP